MIFDEVISGFRVGFSGACGFYDLKPDLVFLDIQMKDGSGFDLLEIVPDVQFKLIFTTASDEFAVKAFKFAAVDYLLKPIDPDELTSLFVDYPAGAGSSAGSPAQAATSA